jgi:hypothetical protein
MISERTIMLREDTPNPAETMMHPNAEDDSHPMQMHISTLLIRAL